MSNHVIETMENNDMISQKIRLDHSVNLAGLRLKLLKFGTIVGTLTANIKAGSTSLGNMTLTTSDFANIPDTYFYGYVLMETENVLAIRKLPTVDYLELTIEITLTGYSNDTDNYISLMRESDQFVDDYNTDNYPLPRAEKYDLWAKPYGLELYTLD